MAPAGLQGKGHRAFATRPSSPWQDRQPDSRCSASEPAEAETAANKIANCNAIQNVVTDIRLGKWNLGLSGQTGYAAHTQSTGPILISQQLMSQVFALAILSKAERNP